MLTVDCSMEVKHHHHHHHHFRAKKELGGNLNPGGSQLRLQCSWQMIPLGGFGPRKSEEREDIEMAASAKKRRTGNSRKPGAHPWFSPTPTLPPAPLLVLCSFLEPQSPIWRRGCGLSPVWGHGYSAWLGLLPGPRAPVTFLWNHFHLLALRDPGIFSSSIRDIESCIAWEAIGAREWMDERGTKPVKQCPGLGLPAFPNSNRLSSILWGVWFGCW